ncbi:aminoglycoside phosphotransferase family protein [Micromonospora cathayae]|uniref:Aminoglycoside phosphotransferase family protein n=1 Tax=Micromonospora cathayae TaxID=3028804 RepID=A0ABY7ZSA6_9ACTN|nr:aminoglycoside phosphotransferase family protein [Micromonospora sp. HUAS 3]WDZ85077.1 aminoglycoside phosphotransferase family protein [Micromonospora sp. HUAS 3]
MSAFLTPEQLAHRTARAVDAAVRAARGLGLTVTGPRVLHDVFSVVVHLEPAPVVARVLTVLPHYADLASQATRQRAELGVVRWLADRGVPVIPPSPLVPAEPVQVDGFSMTFWQYVEPAPDAEPDYVANCGLVAGLHAAMRDYPGELSFLSAAEPRFIEDSLALLAERPDLVEPADLDRAGREWRALEPMVRSRAEFEARFPGIDLRPVHGDCPPANIFPSLHGNLYADFEMVTLGPVEWDLAGLGPDGEAAYDREADRLGLRRLDRDVLRFVTAVGMLRGLAALALAPQLPMLVEAIGPLVEQWRSTPFAGGLAD